QNCSSQRHVRRLCAAGGEYDFPRIGADEVRHLPPSRFDGFVCPMSRRVQAGRVAEALAEEREHRFKDLLRNWSRRVVVEIDHRPAGSLLHASMPPRRMFTCSRPPARRISAAVAERLSVRQTTTTGGAQAPKSCHAAGSCASGTLIAPSIW